MTVTILRNKTQHQEALARMEALWGAKRKTPEGEELELLMLVVEAYERAHLEPPPPDPIAAIEFRMEQMGLENPAALAALVDLTRGRVSELLNRKRPLTLDHVRRFSKIGVPPEVLIAEYELDEAGGRGSQ